MKRLVVFPGDPLFKYLKKGEIKERYWNPDDIFDEVHVISLCDNDTSPQTVQAFAGRAKFFIHTIGRPNPLNFLIIRQRALDRCRQIEPDLVKGHGALVMGYFAVYCSERIGCPSVVSLHSDHSILRTLRAAGISNISRGLYQLAYRFLGLEHYTLRNANVVVCAYEFPTRHAKSFGSGQIEVIYNRVNVDRFAPVERKISQPIRLLTVGNHIHGKQPAAIIQALPHIAADLTVVGQGPLTDRLKKMAQRLGVSHRTTFIPAVTNSQIHTVYQQHDIFCMSIRYPGICIPVLEAMACGLPVVINQPLWEALPEFLGELAIVVENTGNGFAQGVNRLIEVPGLIAKTAEANRKCVLGIAGKIMEEKEAALFTGLMAKNRHEKERREFIK